MLVDAFTHLIRPGKFALVGLVNTTITLTVIFFVLRAGLGDYPANFAGYASGLTSSFLLNRRFTFRRQTTDSAAIEAMRFLAAVAISYTANLATLTLTREAGHAGTIIAHLPAMAVYSGTFYLLSSRFVFAERRP